MNGSTIATRPARGEVADGAAHASTRRGRRRVLEVDAREHLAALEAHRLDRGAS